MPPTLPIRYQAAVAQTILRCGGGAPVGAVAIMMALREIEQPVYLTYEAVRYWLRRMETAGLLTRPRGPRSGWAVEHTRTASGLVVVQYRLIPAPTHEPRYHRLCRPEPIIRPPRQLALPLAG